MHDFFHSRQLDRIEFAIWLLTRQMEEIMSALDDLNTQVADLEAAQVETVDMLDKIKAALDVAIGSLPVDNSAELVAISARIKVVADALRAADAKDDPTPAAA